MLIPSADDTTLWETWTHFSLSILKTFFAKRRLEGLEEFFREEKGKVDADSDKVIDKKNLRLNLFIIVFFFSTI